jgi:hypothetical protein
MTMTTHTPYPWIAITTAERWAHVRTDYIPAGARCNPIICRLPVDSEPGCPGKAEVDANARLIAAAPDLLAALQAVAALRICWPAHVEQLVRSAIEKATE